MIWLTSDWHFNHDREFIWKPRGFTSVEEMNEEIIQRHNEVVKDSDTVYALGDLMLSPDVDKGLELINRLNGKICFVRGNHDTDRRVQAYLQSHVLCMGDAYSMKCNGYHFYLSHYPTLTANLEKESLKQCILNLYGHTHQTTNFYNDMPFMYHVGVDSHSCYPVSIEQIIEDMKYKVLECKEQL